MRIANPGDTVIIGPGTYEEGDLGPPRSGIRGRSIAFRGDPTGQLTGDPPGAVRVVVRAPATTGFLILGKRFIEIADLEIVGGSDAGIQARDGPGGGQPSDTLTLRRLSVRGSAKRGIDLRGVGGTVWIDQCEARENGAGGISIEGDGTTTNVVVSNSRIEGNAGPGLFLRLVVSGNISGNAVHANAKGGIVVRASKMVQVRDNRLTANEEQALNAGTVEPVNDLVVEGNESEGLGKTGFLVAAWGEVRIQENRVQGPSQAGGVAISVEGVGSEPSHGFVNNNSVTEASDDCFLFRNLTTLTASMNTALGCGGNGLRFESVSSSKALGNRLQRLTRSGILVNGGNSVDLSSNVVEEAGGGGIVVNAGSEPLQVVRVMEGEIVRASGAGVSVRGANAVRVSGTTIRDGSGSGLALWGVERIDVRRLEVLRLGGTGLSVGSEEDWTAKSVRIASGRWLALAGGGLKIWGSGNVAISQVEVLDSGGPGISVIGSPSTSVEMTNSTVGMHQADGIFVRGARAGSLINNRVFSNRQSGIVLRSTDNLFVGNNLVYANRGEGLAIGVGGEFSTRTTVVFNTLYGNGLRGLRIDGPAESATIEGGVVLNNIMAGNQGGGVAIARTAMMGALVGFNVNADGYVADTRRNDFDIQSPPLFINPAGADGILGEEGFRDDDFRLAHRRTGQAENSPAVDAGSDSAEALGVSNGTTALDGLPDAGRADAGFHYGLEAISLVRTLPLPFMPLFVRSGGSDTNDGRSPSRALGSIRSAFERAVAGVTVVVGPGTYREGDIRIRNFSGRVTFLADPTGFLTGDIPGPVLVDASGFDTGFVLLNGGPVSIRGFHVTGAAQAGIQVRSGADQAEVVDNVVFSNQRRGIEINGAHGVAVRNNLVYANGTGGIQVQGSRSSVIEGNTVYANGADGILIGTHAPGGAASDTAIRRNIVAENGELVPAANGVQVKVETNSREGFTAAYNVVWGRTPFAGNTPRSDSDLVTDPLFENPAGDDGVLGGEGFVDDDFTLKQVGAVQEVSPAVDLDVDTVNALRWGSTSKSGLPDFGPADAGYHYPVFHPHVRVAPPIFVRRSGNDRNDGSSADRAVRSIERALEVAEGAAWIVIGPGRYSVPALVSGSRRRDAATLILWGDETGRLTGEPPGPVVLDFGGRRGLTLNGSAVIHGLWLTNSRNATLRILGSASGVWIRNSVFCGADGDGLWSSASGVDLVNILSCGNRGWGVRLTQRRGSGYVRLVNATVAQNASGGVWAADPTRSHVQLRLANNIIADNGGPGAMLYVGAHRLVSWGYNLNSDGYAKARVSGPGELSASPQFDSKLSTQPPACPLPTAYRLGAASPARNAGTGDLRLLGLLGRSATGDGEPDRGLPDLGYHGPIYP